MAEVGIWGIRWFNSSLFIGQRAALVACKKCDLVLSENYMHLSQVQFILSQESHVISNNISGELDAQLPWMHSCI